MDDTERLTIWQDVSSEFTADPFPWFEWSYPVAGPNPSLPYLPPAYRLCPLCWPDYADWSTETEDVG